MFRHFLPETNKLELRGISKYIASETMSMEPIKLLENTLSYTWLVYYKKGYTRVNN